MAIGRTTRLMSRADILGEGHEASTLLKVAAAAIALVWGFLLLIAQENVKTPLTWDDASAITVMLFGATIVSVGVVALDVGRGKGWHAGGIALVLSVIALATLSMYWTGMSIVLGSAGVILGGAARRRAIERGTGKLARIAQIVGLVVVVVAVSVLVVMTVTNFAPGLPQR